MLDLSPGGAIAVKSIPLQSPGKTTLLRCVDGRGKSLAALPGIVRRWIGDVEKIARGRFGVIVSLPVLSFAALYRYRDMADRLRTGDISCCHVAACVPHIHLAKNVPLANVHPSGGFRDQRDTCAGRRKFIRNKRAMQPCWKCFYSAAWFLARLYFGYAISRYQASSNTSSRLNFQPDLQRQ